MEKGDKRIYSTGKFTNFSSVVMSTQLRNSDFDDSSFQQNLPQVYRAVLRQFRSVTATFVLFNLLFIAFFTAELLLLILFLPFLMQTAWLALSLSGLFLTIFSYFVLLFYYQAKKPDQLDQLKDLFISSCRQLAGNSAGEPQHHLTIAAALTKLSTYLEDFEWQFYRIPRFLQSLNRPLSSLSAYCHWQDVFRFKQILLHAAIEEHLCQIRFAPTDLEVHASLANTYVALSKIFVEPKRSPNPAAFRRNKETFDGSFQIAARLANEEFKILNHYAPNDPWVHEQLARNYGDLQMPKEEMNEIETLLKLRPQDQDLMMRLGSLYFEQGLNANGLQIYQELKAAHFQKADDLIIAYGRYQGSLPSCFQ